MRLLLLALADLMIAEIDLETAQEKLASCQADLQLQFILNRI